jgi:cell division protease FtsH
VVSPGAHDDLGRATLIMREMITRLGMSRKLGLPALTRVVGAPMLGQTTEERIHSEATAREIDEEVRQRMGELYDRAKRILADRRSELEAAADTLIARESMTGDELARIAADAAKRRADGERAGTTAA